ncbi:MAG: CoA transferase [Dehalococcoidia bacterium]|nr:CoA transferase [Dehalococcoidia bacterium]
MSTSENDISTTLSTDATGGALDGLVVVERAEGIAGPVCGKLMAGFGAEVIKVEHPMGDISRKLGPFPNDERNPEASGLFLYLNAGKKSVVIDSDDPSHRERLRELIDRADVLVDGATGLEAAGPGYGELSGTNPDLVLVSITPFGLSGPYRDCAATNLVVHALSGELGLAGSRHLPPLKKGGNLADYHAGCHGFIGAVAALLARERVGGQHVEVSHLESLTSILGATMNGWLYNENVSRRGDADPWSLGTAARRGEDGPYWEPSGVWQAKDGYVLAYGRSSADWTGAIREMSEELPELASPRFTTEEGRGEHAEELTRLFGQWVSEHTKEEVYRLAQRYGHAYGYVATARDLLESPQLKHRRFFVEMEHPVAARVTMPGAPFRMSRTPLVTRRAPLLGEHDNSPLPSRSERMGRGDGHKEGRLPLEGLRVVDFTHIWAGPYCTRILADLGAEVIKVESPRRGDGGRGKGVGRYHAYSRNKLAIAMDLRTEEGQRHIRKLISVSDVVVENFSVGVTGRLGVDYEDCRVITPSIVYVALPAFGRTGPESGFVGMGATQEAMSGLLSISSYPGAVPSPTGVKYGDPNGGMLAAVAVLAAIHHRAATGEGQLIDLSQREANIFTLPELVLDYAMNGRTAEAISDKRPDRAPTGLYPCKDDEWVAIDVETDGQFAALWEVMGTPHLVEDSRFATPGERKRNEGELDRIIEAWTRERSAESTMCLLQDAGVPSGAVLTNKQVAENEHFRARGFFQQDAEGRVHLAAPWRFSKAELGVRRFAPELGQDNFHVLRDILGVPEDDIRAMEREGVIKGPVSDVS